MLPTIYVKINLALVKFVKINSAQKTWARGLIG